MNKFFAVLGKWLICVVVFVALIVGLLFSTKLPANNDILCVIGYGLLLLFLLYVFIDNFFGMKKMKRKYDIELNAESALETLTNEFDNAKKDYVAAETALLKSKKAYNISKDFIFFHFVCRSFFAYGRAKCK